MSAKEDIERIREALFTGQHSRKKHIAQQAFLRIEKRMVDLDTLVGWITDPGGHGLMFRVWDTGRQSVVVDLTRDDGSRETEAFEGHNAEGAISAAAHSIRGSK